MIYLKRAKEGVLPEGENPFLVISVEETSEGLDELRASGYEDATLEEYEAPEFVAPTTQTEETVLETPVTE